VQKASASVESSDRHRGAFLAQPPIGLVQPLFALL